MAADGPVATFRRDRRQLIEALQGKGIDDLDILHAFDTVPRHLFVPPELHHRAYEDVALPIGDGQTISRPSVHAHHLGLAELSTGEKVLEVGTGSGFQTALLATLGGEVFSIEVVPRLSARAASRLAELGIRATLRIGDGAEGWPEEAPFDVILVGAAAPELRGALLAQLAPAGRLIAPLGDAEGQTLVRVRRTPQGWLRETLDEARFVPLVGHESDMEIT